MRLEVVKQFNLRDFDKLKDIKRADKSIDEEKGKGSLYIGDTFTCNEEMYKYLSGGNALRENFVKIVEEEIVKEEVKEEVVEEVIEEKDAGEDNNFFNEVNEKIKNKNKKHNNK